MSVWDRLVNEIEDYSAHIREIPIMPQVTPTEIRYELEKQFTFEKPLNLDALTADVIRFLRKWNMHVVHPRYFGLFNPTTRPSGIIADTLAALYNCQLAAWKKSPIANEIERLTLNFYAKNLGYDPDHVLANFTSGGSEANLSAVLAALAHHFPDSSETGLTGLKAQPVIYVTSESHHSFNKICRMTGLGTKSLRLVPTTAQFIMDTKALETCIQSDLEAGKYPFMVVGTAGTTGAGLIDPLLLIAKISQKHGLWFHADAAWGGSVVLVPRLKPFVSGIEQADSITWDAHKWLSVPMGAGMFFCRHPEAVKSAFAITTSYMPQASSANTVDPYTTTIQWSRRAIGLKVFMTLAELGMPGYAELIDRQTAMGDLLRVRLHQAGWNIKNETPLPVICFTHPDIQNGRITTVKILQTIYARAHVWISDVVLGEQERVLRACITSYQTDESDIEFLIKELQYALTS
jgi:glutamate/tyrosine decarboxylase-like PLP-dependent enzyme